MLQYWKDIGKSGQGMILHILLERYFQGYWRDFGKTVCRWEWKDISHMLLKINLRDIGEIGENML